METKKKQEAVFSKSMLLALIIYPVVLAFISIFLIRVMGAKGLVSVKDVLSTFVFIASIFSLIPAFVIFLFTLPTSMSSKTSDKVTKAGVIVKITSAFIVIDSILFFLSLYMF